MRLFLSIFLLSFLSCSSQLIIEDPKDPEIEEQSSNTYLALGDSYTIGVGVDISDRWSVQLAARLTADSLEVATPDIVAKTGWSTDQLISAINAAAPNLDSTYSMVSLLIGVNNQFRGNPLSQYRTELPKLLETAIQYAGGNTDRVFMLSIPDYGLTPFGQGRNPEQIAEELDIYNAIADSICQVYQITFHDITKVSRTYGLDSEYVAADDLHPSGAMYKAWVNEIYQDVKSILK